MTYREVAMWEILEVLRRVGRGESKSAVARTTGHSRVTIRRYVRTAVELGWDLGAEEPSEELAAQVYARHRPASERSPGDTEARLLEHRDQIKEWLKAGPTEKRALRLSKVHELLRRRNVDVPYSTLHRFAVKPVGSVTDGASPYARPTVSRASWRRSTSAAWV
jgi:transposase